MRLRLPTVDGRRRALAGFGALGLGALAVSSITDSALPLITGITILTAAIIIFANLVVDLLYAVIDPRVRVT